MTEPRRFPIDSRKLAVFAGAAVLAGGVGVAVASQGDGRTGSQAALAQAGGMPGQPGQGAGPGRDGRSGGMPGGPPAVGGPGGIDVSALADELGVTAGELEDALQTLQPPAPGGTGADPLVAALAEALGLSEARVQAALEAVRPSAAAWSSATTARTP